MRANLCCNYRRDTQLLCALWISLKLLEFLVTANWLKNSDANFNIQRVIYLTRQYGILESGGTASRQAIDGVDPLVSVFPRLASAVA